MGTRAIQPAKQIVQLGTQTEEKVRMTVCYPCGLRYSRLVKKSSMGRLIKKYESTDAFLIDFWNEALFGIHAIMLIKKTVDSKWERLL